MDYHVRKCTYWHMRPAKTQISLRIRTVCSETSLLVWKNLHPFLSEMRPVMILIRLRMRSLIRIITGRTCWKIPFLTLWPICFFSLDPRGFWKTCFWFLIYKLKVVLKFIRLMGAFHSFILYYGGVRWSPKLISTSSKHGTGDQLIRISVKS